MKLYKLLIPLKHCFTTIPTPDSALSSFLNESKNKSLSQITSNLQFPYKFEGFPFIPEEKASFLFKQICAYSNLSESWLLGHLKKIYTGTLYAIANNDQVFMDEYLQKNLVKIVQNGIFELNSNGFRVNLIVIS